ncbi:hypothetical protein niasHT_030554 [Heterodera trifolii]|uniref:Uncharacterized protein n=1 Tax=Heterodera trifolii TaxID=157864 RepID=A0ABD2IY16_9BILA
MPDSSLSSSSSSGGSLKPDTLKHSGWRNDNLCKNIYEQHTASNPIAPAPSHHCAVVTFLCKSCAKTTHKTFEFNCMGKDAT